MKNWSQRGNKGERNDGTVNTRANLKLKKTDKGEIEVSHLEPLGKAVRWVPNFWSHIGKSTAPGRRKHRRGNPSGY